MKKLGEAANEGRVRAVTGQHEPPMVSREREMMRSRDHACHESLDLLGHLLVRLLTVLKDLSRLDVRLVVLEILLLQTLSDKSETRSQTDQGQQSSKRG